MKDRCITAVSQAIGRQITQAEAQNIEKRIVKAMRVAASKDPAAFRAMSADERLKAGAQLAGQDIINEAVLKKRRVSLAIEAFDRLSNTINEMKLTGMSGIEALERTLSIKHDGKASVMSAESRAGAIRNLAIAQLKDTFDAVDPRFWGLLENPEGVRDLTRAMFGEKVDNPIIEKGAQAWKDTADGLREQFNQAGGKIGQLEDWALPYHHSQIKLLKAKADKWVQFIMPLLKREKYFNDDGTRMSDQQLEEVMRGVWMTLATDGLNKQEVGVQGSGMLANRNSEARSIHFKDADSYLAYQAAFGEKSIWGVMTGHVDALSKEIAMLETYGPNPDNTFDALLQKELKAAAVSDPENTAKYKEEAIHLRDLYDFISGKQQEIVKRHLAQGFDTLRNWLVSSRLGSAVITSFTDEATLHLTAHVNNLPEMQLIRNELAALNPANKEEENLANRAGLAVDTMIGHLNRWGQDSLGPTFSSKMASGVMRASGMEALDGARRRAFGVTYMSALGEMVGKYDSLADLSESDHRILLSKGITELDWQIWKQAELEKWGAGNGVLTPGAIMRIPDEKIAAIVEPMRLELFDEMNAKLDAINDMPTMSYAERVSAQNEWDRIYSERLAALDTTARRDAMIKLLGATLEETDMAVIRPGAADRFMTGAGMKRGTWKGELTRSFFVFKAFPMAMISRHWMRGMGMETAGGKAAYISSLIVGTTILGAVSQTVNDLLSGKDVRNYNPFQGEHGAKNWLAAFLKGGSLGIYGDFLFSGATQGGQNGPISTLLGPVAGLVEDAYNLTQGNLIQAAQGKDPHFGAELVRFIKGNTPGASLWYLKAALDHMIFHQLQEYFSPGYLGTMQRRAQREFGQSFWWTPGTGIDGMRAPNLAKAVGE